MNLAFCVEGLGDQEVLRILLSRLLNTDVRSAALRQFRPGGFSNVLKFANKIVWECYHQGFDGALFAIDNDGVSPTHDGGHEMEPGCRYCDLQSAAVADMEKVARIDRPSLPPLRFFFTVPIQTIETWLVLGGQIQHQRALELYGREPWERRELKRLVYGVEDPDTDLLVRRGSEIAATMDIETVGRASQSFDHFVRQVGAQTA